MFPFPFAGVAEGAIAVPVAEGSMEDMMALCTSGDDQIFVVYSADVQSKRQRYLNPKLLTAPVQSPALIRRPIRDGTVSADVEMRWRPSRWRWDV